MRQDRDRRQDERVCSSITVRVAGDTASGPLYTKDIGLGGLFLLVSARWKVGDQATLLIEDRSTQTQIETAATVTHVADDGVGFTFDAPSTLVEDQIRMLIVSRFQSGATYQERRAQDRWHVSRPCRWRLDEREEKAQVVDLNPKGARLQSTTSPPLESTIFLLLPATELDSQSPALMGCRARVVNHLRDGFAVEFPDPSTAFQRNVLRLIAAT